MFLYYLTTSPEPDEGQLYFAATMSDSGGVELAEDRVTMRTKNPRTRRSVNLVKKVVESSEPLWVYDPIHADRLLKRYGIDLFGRGHPVLSLSLLLQHCGVWDPSIIFVGKQDLQEAFALSRDAIQCRRMKVGDDILSNAWMLTAVGRHTGTTSTVKNFGRQCLEDMKRVVDTHYQRDKQAILCKMATVKACTEIQQRGIHVDYVLATGIRDQLKVELSRKIIRLKTITRQRSIVDARNKVANWDGSKVLQETARQTLKDVDRLESHLRAVNGLLTLVRYGKVYPHLCFPGSVTGRITSRKPSIANLPKEYRKVIVPPEGMSLVSFDIRQSQLSIFAGLFGLKELEEKVAGQVDIFQEVAEKHGISRELAKECILSAIFGARDESIKERTGGKVGLEEAFSFLPGAMEHVYKVQRSAKENGFVETPLGGRIYLSRSKAHAAVNYLVQAVEADIIAMAVAKIWEMESANVGFGVQIVALLYDELVAQWDRKDRADVSYVIGCIESVGHRFGVTLRVKTYEHIENWAQRRELP